MDIQKIISVLEDLVYEDINNEEYWKAIKEAKALIKELKQALTISTVEGQSEQIKCEGCNEPFSNGLCGSCCSDLASGMY